MQSQVMPTAKEIPDVAILLFIISITVTGSMIQAVSEEEIIREFVDRTALPRKVIAAKLTQCVKKGILIAHKKPSVLNSSLYYAVTPKGRKLLEENR